MIRIIIAGQAEHAQSIRMLFWEYLQWANAKVEENFGVSFDIAAMLEDDMSTLDKFMPPEGRLLLGYVEDQLAGIACLKALTDGIGEVKRMYVRPQARCRGLGRALFNQLLEEARQIGYERVRLDSARFMTKAHQQITKVEGVPENKASLCNSVIFCFNLLPIPFNLIQMSEKWTLVLDSQKDESLFRRLSEPKTAGLSFFKEPGGR